MLHPCRIGRDIGRAVWPVCRTNHENVAGTAVPGPRDAIEFGEELRDNPAHEAACVAMHATLGSDRVQLVKEENAGVGVACTLEYTTDVCFQFFDLHVQQLGALDRKEVQQERGRNHLGKQGLACAWQSTKNDSHGPKM